MNIPNPFSSLAGLPARFAPRPVDIYTDGAIRPDQARTGLAAIVRGPLGEIKAWWGSTAGAMTNNEAEYAAVILGLEKLLPKRPAHVRVYTDSKVVVDQMNGFARVHADNLRPLHFRLRALQVHFQKVSFIHIPREQNRLADALANEMLEKV